MQHSYWSQELWRLAQALLAGLVLGAITSYWSYSIIIALSGYIAWMLVRIYRIDRWIERGFKRSETPDASGVFENIIGKVHSLKSGKKRSKKMLAKMLRQFTASAAAMPDATVTLNEDFEIQWFNEMAEQLLGLQAPRDIGIRIDNLWRDPAFREFLHDTDINDLNIVSPFDAMVKLQFHKVKYQKDNLLLTARDVSIQERVDSIRREFVSNASHELRTPLTVIRGYLEVMSEDRECTPSVRDKMQTVLEQTTRMELIISELLTLSRLENTSLDSDEGEIMDITAMLEGLARDVVQSGQAEPGQVTVSADATLCLRGISSEIISVCSNLLHNALRHNPPGTTVELAWFRNGADAPCLSVTDEGDGIEERHLPRLTERFYRVDTGRSRDHGGTGLGLAIVKHIVQRHGGHMDISSTTSVGSSFTCCFTPARIVDCVNS
jgi:two-component system phosphate regulon sensor histidine kinase PhoR